MPEYVTMHRLTAEFYHMAITWHLLTKGPPRPEHEYEVADTRYMDSLSAMYEGTARFFASVILFCAENQANHCVESLHDEIYELIAENEREKALLEEHEKNSLAASDPKYRAILKAVNRMGTLYERGIDAIHTAIFARCDDTNLIVLTPSPTVVIKKPVTEKEPKKVKQGRCPIHKNCPVDIYYDRLVLAGLAPTLGA